MGGVVGDGLESAERDRGDGNQQAEQETRGEVGKWDSGRECSHRPRTWSRAQTRKTKVFINALGLPTLQRLPTGTYLPSVPLALSTRAILNPTSEMSLCGVKELMVESQ